MRKLGLASLLFFCFANGIFAQSDADVKSAKSTASSIGSSFGAYQKFIDSDSTHWCKGGDFNLSFKATSLMNWIAGGEDQVSVAPILNLYGNYKKGNLTWENYLTLGLGFSQNGERRGVKSDDRLYYTSKVGRNISKTWAYTALVAARTQMMPGYQYQNNEIIAKTSDFLAPMQLYLSLGVDYKPKDWISVVLSPVMGRAIWARSDSLTVLSTAGLTKTITHEDGTSEILKKRSRYEFGGGAAINLQGHLFKDKLSYSSQLELFSNYVENPQNIDVFWTLASKILLLRYVGLDLRMDLKYDDDQKTIIKTEFGDEQHGAKIQFRWYMGLGFLYKF